MREQATSADRLRRARGNRRADVDRTTDGKGVALSDFYAYMPMHSYIFAPARDMWPAKSVNVRVPPVVLVDAQGKQVHVPASVWLDHHRPVEQMTWAPGLPMIMRTA